MNVCSAEGMGPAFKIYTIILLILTKDFILLLGLLNARDDCRKPVSEENMDQGVESKTEV